MATIRPEQPTDRDAVYAVEAEAFGRANEAELARVLFDTASPVVSLVAEQDGAVRGHVILSPVSLENDPEGLSLGALGPIGVSPDRQGKGLGSALVEAGLAGAREIGWKAVFLVGNPAYYSRFGFVLAVPRGFTYGNPHFDPALQVIELEPGALTGASGQAFFHPAFGEHE